MTDCFEEWTMWESEVMFSTRQLLEVKSEGNMLTKGIRGKETLGNTGVKREIR
jgi:hypothetical protein